MTATLGTGRAPAPSPLRRACALSAARRLLAGAGRLSLVALRAREGV